MAVAVAEMRSARRLVRTWLFTALSLGSGLLFYLYYAAIHGFGSSYSATVGFIHPRFLTASTGIVLLWIFAVAMVFLAFDVRARDHRERMTEVLDSRPVGNLTLLGGRLLGLVLTAWLPILGLVILVQLIGFSAILFDWPFGAPLEPWSIASFLIIDAPLTLALWCALVILLAVILGNRLLVAVIALALLGLNIWGLLVLPLYLLPVFSGVTASTDVISDILPRFATASDLFQRLALILLTGGLLTLAAVLHPRPDRDARPRWLMMGVALIVAGGGCLGLLAGQHQDERALREHWLAAQQARQDEPRADLRRLSGRVVIEPGRELILELEYQLAAPPGEPLETLLFSLNPGMEVTGARLNGEPVGYSEAAGLLSVELPNPLAAGDVATLALTAAGAPEPAFGYLDSAVDLTLLDSDGNGLALLGSQAAIFDNRYVALMPGARWLPIPGAAVGRGDPARYGNDYYTVDLEVVAPADWLIAGPGRRQGTGGRFRFQPIAPVREVALFGSRFERRAMEVAGIELELLISPGHTRNVEFFADAAEVIQARLEELFSDAAKLGLGYPYRALSLVEVPAQLRAYGGGWRMGSVQSLPGVMLLREYGFPTSRFEFRFIDPRNYEDQDGGIAAAKAKALEDFFQNDFSGGNPFYGVAGGIVANQTGARGEGAIAVDFLIRELAAQVLVARVTGFFAAHAFASGDSMDAMATGAFQSAVTGQAQSIGASVRAAATYRPSIWDRALGVSLMELDPAVDSLRALNVLWLKIPAVARSLIDGLGRDAVAGFLAELRRRYQGRTFTAEQFAAVAAETGADFGPIVGDWLRATSLPGFLASPVEVVRLIDDDRGQPRYQVLVHVRNAEPTPGLVRLSYTLGEGDAARSHDADPVRIPSDTAVELGLVLGEPPTRLWLASYLALNRHSLYLGVPAADQQQAVNKQPFAGFRASTWRPDANAGIVVDDLDPGFAVDYAKADDGLRLSAFSFLGDGAAHGDMDQGLPVYTLGGSSAGWLRQALAGSWGKYRHTVARAAAGDGSARAIFTATLPVASRWRLDYHLPDPSAGAGSFSAGSGGIRVSASVAGDDHRGSYDLKIRAAATELAVEFDASAAEVGWNNLGEFELPAGEVQLVVSNETSGQTVVADAIRWRRVGSP